MQALDRDEICLEKVRLESNMKPKLRAESVDVLGDLKEGREKVGDFRYLLRQTNEEKFCFRLVEK